MKFQLLFLVVVAIVATFITTETEAAPSKQHAKHQLPKASDLKLWMQQLGQFLQNGKRHEHKTTKITPNITPRAIENPALVNLVKYLKWVDELVIVDYVYEILVLANDPAEAYYDFFSNYLYDALRNVDVDMYALTDDYYYGLEDEFYGFMEDAEVFWKSWVDDPEHIRENLLLHIPQVVKYLKAYGEKTVDFFVNLMYLCATLLTPDALVEVEKGAEIALIQTGLAIDNLFAALKPPTDIVSPPTIIYIEDFLYFFLNLGKRNVSAIIFEGLSTVQQLRGVRLTFDEDLVALLGEGSVDGADLGSQGQNITGNFEAVVDARYIFNRLALDNAVYSYFYGGGWDFLYALGDLLFAHFNTLEEIPPVALETIAQLEGLVETLAPEYQQRASDLVTQALLQTATIVAKYLEVFTPEE